MGRGSSYCKRLGWKWMQHFKSFVSQHKNVKNTNVSSGHPRSRFAESEERQCIWTQGGRLEMGWMWFPVPRMELHWKQTRCCSGRHCTHEGKLPKENNCLWTRQPKTREQTPILKEETVYKSHPEMPSVTFGTRLARRGKLSHGLRGQTLNSSWKSWTPCPLGWSVEEPPDLLLTLSSTAGLCDGVWLLELTASVTCTLVKAPLKLNVIHRFRRKMLPSKQHVYFSKTKPNHILLYYNSMAP